MEKKLNQAYSLLRLVLCYSTVESEFDVEIHEFLLNNNELPENWHPYWEETSND